MRPPPIHVPPEKRHDETQGSGEIPEPTVLVKALIPPVAINHATLVHRVWHFFTVTKKNIRVDVRVHQPVIMLPSPPTDREKMIYAQTRRYEQKYYSPREQKTNK